MPFDKWGIPFLYPTKTSAGITGSGSAFSWYQNNDFRKDNQSGMIRLGKEQDQCKLINLTTGEWEFPYLPEGDGLSISGPTGHHSGGVTHGCQGFTYMCDGNFDANPPRFRFRKETYHVQYNNDPQTGGGGEWTSPFATGPVKNNWKGYGWVRYNKKDGRGPGKDSVICEAWWNDNPTADITNWKMLKRTEDKGAGASNWGVSATCDGASYQVGTWSNIQFRFKSAASDFSLHPLIPEGEDDPVVHSIGGENMSFSDSEGRGYGKRADMPRDIEMKCLFKWDAGGDGKCRFKNISLREIDPTLSFDDTPETPPDPPTGSTTIQGSFKFQNDVNTLRSQSSCAGSTPEPGGGGGSGGLTKFYSQPPDNNREMGDSDLWQHRTRITERALSSSSGLHGKLIKQVDIPLKKVGTPASTPTVNMKIYSLGGSVIYESPTHIDPNTLTTSFVYKTFDFSTNTHVMVTGDRIGVHYEGTSETNYIIVGYIGTDVLTQTQYEQYEAGSWELKSRELAMDIWE